MLCSSGQFSKSIHGKLQFYSYKYPIWKETVYGKSLIKVSCKKKPKTTKVYYGGYDTY